MVMLLATAGRHTHHVTMAKLYYSIILPIYSTEQHFTFNINGDDDGDGRFFYGRLVSTASLANVVTPSYLTRQRHTVFFFWLNIS